MVQPKSPTNKKGRPRRKRLVRLAICLLAVPIVVLVAERWRGRWALERWKNDAAAKGELFEAPLLWPPASDKNREFTKRLERATGDAQPGLSDYAGHLLGIVAAKHGGYRRGSQEPRPQSSYSQRPLRWEDLNERIAANQSNYRSLRELGPAPIGKGSKMALSR